MDNNIVPQMGPIDPAPDTTAYRGDVGSSLRRRKLWALWLIAAMFTFLFLLTFGIHIEGAVVAEGSLSVESRVKTITHPTGGVLSKLYVKEGDRVKAGQTLLEFDTDVAQPSAQFSNLSLDQLLVRKARLDAETAGLTRIGMPPEMEGRSSEATLRALGEEQRLLRLRQQEVASNRRLLDERIIQFQELIRSYDVQIESAQKQLVLIEPELEGLRTLFEKKLVPINRLNQLERQAVELRGSIGALQANIAQTQARISETQEQRLALQTTRKSEAATELAQVNSAVSDQRIRIAEADDRFNRSIVTAPVNGVVDQMQFITVGSVVPPGQAIAQLVPDKDELIIEAYVSPSDFDQLTIGQKARVTFPSLNENITPDLPGKLIYIAPQPTVLVEGQPPVVRIRVALSSQVRQSPVFRKLKPGTPSSIFLSTQSRSMMSYLFKPLLDQMRYAFRY